MRYTISLSEAKQACLDACANCLDMYDYSDEIKGQCHVCGMPVDCYGYAVIGCKSSFCICTECGYSPCNNSCKPSKGY